MPTLTPTPTSTPTPMPTLIPTPTPTPTPMPPQEMTGIVVSPLDAALVVGSNRTFHAAALDQFNDPINATVTWRSSNTSVGNITGTGMFTAEAPGITTITAASGPFSGNANVTVMAVNILSADVAAFDANRDNHIQRSEAVQAVVAYFNGEISKSTAIAVVLVYFAGL
ncbi:Bacterial Ig-like domain (group 2) [uncultured archaeon]|nr:Bacterial Ig-like domain (group 2) [uncultured archaeon]